ncbi:MAG: hypothetical protein GX066_02550 [Clostridiaceae bacterium]|nr:hypothetical protein [Clostridiaceae bacterium]
MKRKRWKSALIIFFMLLQYATAGLVNPIQVIAAEIDPFQRFMIESMSLSYDDRDALTEYMLDNINSPEDVTPEHVSKVHSYVPVMSYSDVQEALEIFAARSRDGKTAITYLIFYGLRRLQGSTEGFPSIRDLLNETIAGDASDIRGLRFFITVMYQAWMRTGQSIAKNGVPPTKIKLEIQGFEEEKQQVSSMIGLLKTLQQTISSYPGANNFEKLLSFTEQNVNSCPNEEIAAFKVFLSNNGNLYEGDPYPVVPPFEIDAVFKIDGSIAEELIADGHLSVDVGVTNTSGDAKDVLVIVALYNDENLMENVAYISKNVPNNGVENMTAGFRLPPDVTGYSAKAFVWEGTDLMTTSMVPLSDVIYIPRQ